jgi:hypothetical protein
MKKLLLLALVILAVYAASISCSKSSGCTETGLGFTSSPAVNTVEPAAPGPDFPLTISLTQMPSAGATITVSARPENPANATPFYTETRTTTNAQNDFTITGTPQATASVVDITVTSKSCNTNKATGSYRYSRK